MTELEEATNYYLVRESTMSLPLDDRLRYVELSNKFTGKNVRRRKCINSLNQAHMYFSDYIKGNK
jgi:hypothetical protein